MMISTCNWLRLLPILMIGSQTGVAAGNDGAALCRIDVRGAGPLSASRSASIGTCSGQSGDSAVLLVDPKRLGVGVAVIDVIEVYGLAVSRASRMNLSSAARSGSASDWANPVSTLAGYLQVPLTSVGIRSVAWGAEDSFTRKNGRSFSISGAVVTIRSDSSGGRRRLSVCVDGDAHGDDGSSCRQDGPAPQSCLVSLPVRGTDEIRFALVLQRAILRSDLPADSDGLLRVVPAVVPEGRVPPNSRALEIEGFEGKPICE